MGQRRWGETPGVGAGWGGQGPGCPVGEPWKALEGHLEAAM